MSYIIHFSEESDDNLLLLSKDLYSHAREINDKVRSISFDGLSEEDVHHLYNLDALSTPTNVRAYLITTADDSSRLLSAIVDYISSLPEESIVKPLLEPLLTPLSGYLSSLFGAFSGREID